MPLGISQETALTAIAIVAAAIGFGVSQWTTTNAAEEEKPNKNKKRNKKGSEPPKAATESSVSTPAEAIIPGQFDSVGSEPALSASVSSSSSKKAKKKKKAKAAAASSATATVPATASSAPPDAQYESSVDAPAPPAEKPKPKSKRQQKKSQVAASPPPPPPPAAAPTETAPLPPPPPSPSATKTTSQDTDDGGSESWTRVESRQRVDSTTSMTSDSASPVEHTGDPALRPRQGELPLKGFTWDDYEDEDTQEDDESGWDVVKSRRGKSTPGSGSTTTASKKPSSSDVPLSKRQRQNASKRDAKKVAKVEAESERLARLANYRREQEQERIREAYSTGKKTPGGGMSANVDGGRLVWE